MGTDGGMPLPTTDGCTEVDGFVAAARPPLTAYCTRCHGGGNARATAAFDLAMLGMEGSSTAMTRSCNEVLGRINPAAPSASGIFIQPDPAEDNGHPFKFGSTRELTDFRNAILGWFETEGM